MTDATALMLFIAVASSPAAVVAWWMWKDRFASQTQAIAAHRRRSAKKLFAAAGHRAQRKTAVIAQNPVARLTPPRVAQQELQIPSASQVHDVLQTATEEIIYPRAALASGMRRGEMLALRWQDLGIWRYAA